MQRTLTPTLSHGWEREWTLTPTLSHGWEREWTLTPTLSRKREGEPEAAIERAVT